MKKFLILFLGLILIDNCAIAEEELLPIFLDETTSTNQTLDDFEHIDIQPTIYKLKVTKNNINLNTKIQSKNLYPETKKSFTKEMDVNDIIFGLKSDNTISPNRYKGTKTLFTKYELDKLSFQTSYVNNPLSALHTKEKGSVIFTPAYQLNNHLTLKTNHSSNFTDKSKKNELLLNIKPFKDNTVNLNLGASVIHFDTNTKPRSQLNFSTNFRF